MSARGRTKQREFFFYGLPGGMVRAIRRELKAGFKLAAIAQNRGIPIAVIRRAIRKRTPFDEAERRAWQKRRQKLKRINK